MTATEAAGLIANRKLSVEELTRSCLKRIGEWNEAVKAWPLRNARMVSNPFILA